MDIKNPKELEKIIKLCRKLGVDAIEIGNVKFNLGQAPRPTSSILPEHDIPESNLRIPSYSPIAQQVADVIKTDNLSDEDLLFYSATSNESQGQ